MSCANCYQYRHYSNQTDVSESSQMPLTACFDRLRAGVVVRKAKLTGQTKRIIIVIFFHNDNNNNTCVLYRSYRNPGALIYPRDRREQGWWVAGFEPASTGTRGWGHDRSHLRLALSYSSTRLFTTIKFHTHSKGFAATLFSIALLLTIIPQIDY